MSVLKAAQGGDRRAVLIATRDRLAALLDDAEPREGASLAKQLRDTVAELDKIPDGEVSVVDDIAARRAARREAASG